MATPAAEQSAARTALLTATAMTAFAANSLLCRMALGAGPGSLVRLILARGISLALLGVGLGLGFSYALGRALSGHGVSAGNGLLDGSRFGGRG